MEKIFINGGRRLEGEVTITGMKNAALGILPATILCSGPCRLEHLPDIKDIHDYLTILRKIGATVETDGSGTIIDGTPIVPRDWTDVEEECTSMRASYYLLGALLSRFRQVRLPLPGGCNIGARPIDLHIKGFRALGAQVDIKNGYIEMNARTLKGAYVYLDVVSVGATINIMLASVLADGVTTIENAAKEPHIVDVANFLNLAGANIKGAGTDTIKIQGVKSLSPVTYTPIPDQIAAGTYMLAAVATQGSVLVKNVIPEHLDSVIAKIIEMGSEVYIYSDSIRVVGRHPIKGITLKTLPHPGFPTDLQQPAGVLMCIADGTSTIQENIWENRFQYIDELRKMGADVIVNGNVAVFHGVKRLQSAKIQATDLRAGAAMIIAGLVGDGVSEITGLTHIDRGYDHIVDNLALMGSEITRVSE